MNSVRRHIPNFARWTTTVAGLIDISSVIFRPLERRLHRFSTLLPGTSTHLPRIALLITGIFMIVISSGLSKRKRRAWQIAIGIIAASILVGKEESIFAGSLLLILIFFHREFYAESDPTSRWRALGLFLQLFSISLLVGLVLFA